MKKLSEEMQAIKLFKKETQSLAKVVAKLGKRIEKLEGKKTTKKVVKKVSD